MIKKELIYRYSFISKENLKLKPFTKAKKVKLADPPNIQTERNFNTSASELFEYITNYRYRHHWVEGVDSFEFDENEVTRIGTEHVCVINGKHLNFITITKKANLGS